MTPTGPEANGDHPGGEPSPAAGDRRALRVAVLGKGGVGKTVLAALLARVWAEQGRMVLAVDLDPGPGLAVSLGLAVEGPPLPDEAVEERAEATYGWTLAAHLTPAEAVRRYGVPAGTRVRYLGVGEIAHAEHSLRRYFTAVRLVADDFDEPGWVVVVEAGAGPAAPFQGYAKSADVALVVTERTPASLLGAERILALLDYDGTPAEVVEIDTSGDEVGTGTAWSLAVEPAASVPFDPGVQSLERFGPLTGLAPDSVALHAVRGLAGRLHDRYSPERRS